ncbi:hypothetical protein ACFYWN_42640 [Streptomyces sp. NPDC002917]|uniref:hypothetical protein n=1 Tax=Streptomyces sp. NPDC002917 TaxID=3364671 RepID=UPI0036780937
MTNDVFSQAVRERNAAGVTFNQMESTTWRVGGKEGSRSSAWWNNMSNWEMETPPAPKYIPGIAAVLGLPERQVHELIAEQWYGVRPDNQVPRHLRPLLTVASDVAKVDLVTLMDVAQTFSAKNAAETVLAELKAQAEVEDLDNEVGDLDDGAEDAA